MPSSTPRGGTPRPRRASSPSASARSGAAPRPTDPRRGGLGRRRPSSGSTAGSVLVAQEPPEAGGWPLHRWWALGLIVLVLAIMIVPTVRRYVDQRQQIAALQEHITEQQKNVDALSRERARWDDPAYLESQARERLHFVKAGETGYTLTTRQDPAAAEHDPQVVGVDADASALPWYGKVWGSLQAADRLGERVVRTPAPGGSPSAPAPAPAISDTQSPTSTETSTSTRRP